MYAIAAIWNWILSVSFIILPRIDIGIFSIAGPVAAPPTLLWFDSLFGLVFAFGLIAYFISKSTTENHGLIQIAIFEKVWVFVVGVFYFIILQASILVVAVVSVDLFLSLLFLEDLRAIMKI
jgi:hypothetical protein